MEISPSTTMVGLWPGSTSPPPQSWPLQQLPGWEKSGALCRRPQEIAQTKLKENPADPAERPHTRSSGFSWLRQSCPPQAPLGTRTATSPALVPKCRDKGKRSPEEHSCQRLANHVLLRRTRSSITPAVPWDPLLRSWKAFTTIHKPHVARHGQTLLRQRHSLTSRLGDS